MYSDCCYEELLGFETPICSGCHEHCGVEDDEEVK